MPRLQQQNVACILKELCISFTYKVRSVIWSVLLNCIKQITQISMFSDVNEYALLSNSPAFPCKNRRWRKQGVELNQLLPVKHVFSFGGRFKLQRQTDHLHIRIFWIVQDKTKNTVF